MQESPRDGGRRPVVAVGVTAARGERPPDPQSVGVDTKRHARPVQHVDEAVHNHGRREYGIRQRYRPLQTQRRCHAAQRPDNLTYHWRFLSWSFPGWAGFDVEAELVVGFGEAGGLGVELLAERLHGQGVARGAELVQVDFDQVSLDADVAAGA